MNIQQLYNTVSDLNKQISTILKQSGFDTHNDLYDLDCGSDPESLMLREELTAVLDHLDVVHNSIDYLNKNGGILALLNITAAITTLSGIEIFLSTA